MRDAAVSVSLSSFRHRRQDHSGSEVGDAIASLGFTPGCRAAIGP